MKGEKSKSGVFEFYDFRDNLIIDKYDSVLNSMRGNKLKQMKSENSEDALTWNVFRSLQQINPKNWYPYFVSEGLNEMKESCYFEKLPEYIEVPNMLKIKLWQSIDPPPTMRQYQKDEGATEVDIIIESEEFVWFIEAKYKSDISLRTVNNENRNQILRNIDVGTWYAGVRNFYFSLLILDEEHSPNGAELIKQYKQEIGTEMDYFLERFLHRSDGLQNLKGINVFYWKDIAGILKFCSKYTEDEFERLIAKRALTWLESKKIIRNKEWLDEDLSRRYKSYPKELEYVLKVQQFAEYTLMDQKVMKYFLPKGYDEFGFPTNSTLKYYGHINSYYDDIELGFNQFYESGLPWWWRTDKDVEEFSIKFFEVLSECEELGYMNEEEYWDVFNNDPEESLRMTYFFLALWYQEREK